MTTLTLVLIGGCSPSAPEPPAAAPKPVVEVAPPVSPPVTGLHLRSIRASSGSDPASAIDGDAATGWRAEGDPVDESLTLRFESPVRADRIEVTACAGSERTWWNVFVNGAEAGRVDSSPGMSGALNLGPGGEGSLLASVEIQGADGAPGACVAELVLSLAGALLPLRPPRSVEGTVRTASVRLPAAAYHPWYLVDGRPDFAWTEGKDAGGVGETVTLALRAPIVLVAVELWNGDQRSPETFAAGGRARRIAVGADRGATVSLPVADTMGPQRLSLPRVAVGKLFSVAVLEVTRRGPEDPLSLSELRLWDPMGPITIETSGPADRRERLMTDLQGTSLLAVLDRRYEHVCEGPGARRLKLRSNLSFSWTAAGAPGTPRDAYTGDWALRAPGEPWSAIRLAGRRRPIVTSWASPEVDREDLGVVQTAEVARVQDLDPAALSEWLRDAARAPWRGAVECVTRTAAGEGLDPHDWLVRHEAIVVRGEALNDLLWPAG